MELPDERSAGKRVRVQSRIPAHSVRLAMTVDHMSHARAQAAMPPTILAQKHNGFDAVLKDSNDGI